MKQFSRYVVALFIALALVGCTSRAEFEQLKQGQRDILAKLDKMGGGQLAQPQRPQGPDLAKTYSFPVGQQDVSKTKGPQDAWVTIVEVSDFQCPFCKRVNDTLDTLNKEYGDNVRIIFKHNPLPFHQRAMPAAVASECASEQGKFWAMHDAIFTNQQALNDEDLEKYAKTAGVDIEAWTKCFKSNETQAKIIADQQIAARLGARGTPAFFINGRFLSGAQPLEAFKALVDEELAKAKKSGVAQKDYYSQRVVEQGAKTL